jgi:hypothetical protein
LSSSSS